KSERRKVTVTDLYVFAISPSFLQRNQVKTKTMMMNEECGVVAIVVLDDVFSFR
uniref:Uncharacterized protein n=1 Tax=Caenorhabditis japonica TaxID=281687 RepID=A0A8R1EGQ3_CAEJA